MFLRVLCAPCACFSLVMLLAGVCHTSCILKRCKKGCVRLFWAWLVRRKLSVVGMEVRMGLMLLHVPSLPAVACADPLLCPLHDCVPCEYTAMACNAQLLCTCKMSAVNVENVLCTGHACSVLEASLYLLHACWSPSFSDFLLVHRVMFSVCDLSRRPGISAMRVSMLSHYTVCFITNNVQTRACQSWTPRGSRETSH